jgi:NTP pyrophosphatase (non-canonical NTP hydrolase)
MALKVVCANCREVVHGTLCQTCGMKFGAPTTVVGREEDFCWICGEFHWPHCTKVDGGPSKTDHVFAEYVPWHERNFPRGFNSTRSWLKFLEEVGELAAALYRGDRAAVGDGIGDVLISFLGVAHSHGLDPREEMLTAWRGVRQRDYVTYPDGGRPK